MSRSKPHFEGRVVTPPALRKLGTTIAAVALLTSGLGACGGGPGISTGPGADPSAARGRLVAAAADGPVPLEVAGVPPVYAGGATEVARVASEATGWLGARFAAAPPGSGPDRRRLVLRFVDAPATPAEACAGTAPSGRVPPPPVGLRAVFCDGPLPVADAGGRADGTDLAATDRLVTATMDRLFPGRADGGSYRGYPGVSLGGVIGLGVGGGRRFGSGIFAGVHF